MSTILSFTGHRHLKSQDVESLLKSIQLKYPDSVWITGGAVGLDQSAAEFARLNGIPLWLILPFPSKIMGAKWSQAQRDLLASHVKYATKFSVLSPVFKMSVYQDRNVRMVDMSDRLMAFWDGSAGGTGNCVRYARNINHPIDFML